MSSRIRLVMAVSSKRSKFFRSKVLNVLPPYNWATILFQLGEITMARKRYSDEGILRLLREIELKLANGSDVASACRGVGISDATYYNWRKRFGVMGWSQLSKMRSLEKENVRLKKIVAELELDKLILKESLTYLKPRA